jgi:hypothetical protein
MSLGVIAIILGIAMLASAIAGPEHETNEPVQ